MENCCIKTKMRSDEEKKALINRLSRIEGQIRGIRGMVEKDAYCTDILVQVSAVSAALGSFNKELLSNHIRTCVSDDIANGGGEKVDELIELLAKLLK
ncbi:MAG: metal-sensing transcriptional repressor [Clostridia bacterium]|nr:metal-sensing transcriptional repressor [Clostridia bacterium]